MFTFTPPGPLRPLRHCLAAVCSALLIAAPAHAAGNPAQQFQQWSSDNWINRNISLAELGFAAPGVLDSGGTRREYYLPVPAGIAISDAAIQLNARYLRADGGRTSMMLSIDGYPVAARRFNEEQGNASQTIGVDGLPRADGFVRFGVNWSSVLSEQVCTDQRAPGNALRIAADTSFSYRFQRSAITTLSAAWGALPTSPTLLVAGHGLSGAAYDTAWRTGVALERQGKHVRIVVLPAVGDNIDLSRTDIPANLQGLPAFAALSGRQPQHRIKDAAELGALLALGEHGPLQADLVVTDEALNSAMRQALDALQAQIASVAPEAASAYANWITSGFSVLTPGRAADQLSVVRFGASPAIAIPATLGGKAAGLLASLWSKLAAMPVIGVQQASAPRLDDNAVLMSQFGAIAGSIDVLNRADRTVMFELGAVATDGRLPQALAFDLSAAPSINGEAPVVSVFLNDFLLGARLLNADGRPQRVTVDIPRYALSARNELRVTFVRQPTQLRCHDQPTAFPVSILPGSHIRLGKASLDDDFTGVAGKFSNAATLMIPQAWQQQPGSSLPQLIRIASAVGFPINAVDLQVVTPGQTARPQRPFLAFDVALDGYQPAAALHDGKLILRSGKQQALEVSGIDRLATIEVTRASGETGVIYRNIGAHAPVPEGSFRLTRGNLAVLGDSGLLLQIDSDDPGGAKLAEAANPQSLWDRHMVLWLIIMGVIAFILIAARVTHVRKRKQPQEGA